MRETTQREDFLRGIWRENPVLLQMLGLCPALAVTNNVENSLVMGLATLFVLCGSSLLVSLCKRFIPGEIRISVYILIIATFVTVADLCLAAMVPDIHKALGAFIALIVVNCMILGRQESFASKRPVGRALLDALGTGPVGRALLDALGTGLGFSLALFMLGAVREVLGSGSFLGLPLFGPSYEPWIVMILPAGGFLTLGVLLLGLAWWQERQTGEVQ